MNDAENPREDLLDRRARLLARAAAVAVRREVQATVAVVQVGAERVGLPVESLREIVKLPPVVPLPGAPAAVLGIAALHGEVLSVVDLAGCLGIENPGRPGFLAVVDGPDGPAGLAVHGVADFRAVHADELAPHLAAADGRGRPVSAVTTDLVSLLDVPALLARPDLVLGEADGRSKERRG